jgi:hypothetical protein
LERFMIARIGLPIVLCCLLLLAGCVSQDGMRPSNASGITAEQQYRPAIDSTPAYTPIHLPPVTFKGQELPLGKPTGLFPLLEVYLTNRRDRPVEFTRVLLNGDELKTFPNDTITWFQFYPTSLAKPGETVLLQICLERNPQNLPALDIGTRDGESVTVRAPAFTEPQCQIVGLTFSWDMRTALVAYLTARDPAPRRVRLNGRDVSRSVRIMEQPAGQRPGVFAIELPEPLSAGQPVHCRLEFAERRTVQCLLRAQAGISMDAYGVGETDEKLRTELGLDLPPPMLHLSDDVACYDLPQRPGFHAPSVLQARRKGYDAGDARLASAFLCVMARPQISFPVYGQAVDVLQVNPYRLQYSGRDTEPKFIEKEENFFRWAWLAARPRPWHWAPEVAFFPKRKFGRMIEPPELRLLTYAALGNGAKGVHYFAYGNIEGEYHGFQEHPALLAEIKQLNAEIKTLEPILAPALPLSIETIGEADNAWRLYRLTSVDGVLLIVRSLAYTTSREPNRGEHGQPRFRWLAPPDQPIQVAIERPSWFKVGSVTDPLPPDTEMSWRVENEKIMLAIPTRGGGRNRVAEESKTQERLIESEAAHEKRHWMAGTDRRQHARMGV